MENKKILVVGGAGYIGGTVIDLLMTEHFTQSFIVYDSIVYEDSYRKDVTFICGDIRDREQLSKYVEWADVIIWLAALVGDGACAINPALTKEINTDSLIWLTDLVKGKANKRIIFTSTCSVYGAQDGELTEGSPTKPLSSYASTKFEAEQYLVKNHPNSLVFRLGTVFGVGDQFSRIRFDLVVNILTLRASTEKKLTVFGGDQFRPLIHVRDVAKMICDNIYDINGSAFPAIGIYNLCSQNVRIVDLAYQVRNHFPDCTLEVTEMKFEDSRNYRASSVKAKEELGFKPTNTIDFGIIQIKNLIEEKRIKNVHDIRYSNQLYLENLIK